MSKSIQIKTEFIGFPRKQPGASNFSSFKDIPISEQNHNIESDEKRIKQVLMNLQSNALKFTKEGGTIKIVCEFIQRSFGQDKSKRGASKLTIQTIYGDSFSSDEAQSSESINSAESKFEREHNVAKIFEALPDRDKIVITVIDTGIGIKKSDKIKLFKLFGCLQNTRQMNTQGIGLGLVISENIVKAFSGVIGVQSKYGKGTKFFFSIVLDSQKKEE